MEENAILHSNQHGFRRGLSTVTQLVETLHDLAKGINDQSQIEVVFLDLSKAFYRVCHPKLIQKLTSILGNGPMTKWIESKLTDRYQFVQYGAHVSETVPVLSGVPQGSVLGPMLFLLFINDIADVAEVNIRLFADDCILYQRIDSYQDQLKLDESLKKVGTWCREWQMEINTEKTIAMSITKKKTQAKFSYSLGNVPLRNITVCKYLGILISSDLN